jgi:hypothetical protein
MLKKLSRNCHDFMLHCQQNFAINKEDKESCFDICVTITTFLADVVQFLRQADDDFSELPSPHGENSISKNRCMIIASICELKSA